MQITSSRMQEYSRVWIFLGFLTLEALVLLPTDMLIDDRGVATLPDTPRSLLVYSLPPLGFFIAAFLLYSGLTLYREWKNTNPKKDWASHVQRSQAGMFSLAALLLCLLLLAKALHNLYWLLVWDTTADGIGYGWMVLAPLPVGFVCGLMLVVALEGRQRLVGFLYLLLVPGLMIAMSIQAPRVDRVQLTERRAEQVVRAVEAFHARHGFYPRELRYLISWSTPELPKPVIIYGRGWCYEAGDDYYTLGYIYHETWSDPNLVGQAYKTAGETADSGSLCENEIAVYWLQRGVSIEGLGR